MMVEEQHIGSILLADCGTVMTKAVLLEQVAGQYRFIEVDLSELTVSVQDDTAVVEFRQVYRSDRYTDTTRKSLHLRLTDEGWKIVREVALAGS